MVKTINIKTSDVLTASELLKVYRSRHMLHSKWTTHVTIVDSFGVTTYNGELNAIKQVDLALPVLGRISLTIQVKSRIYSD